MNTPTSEDIALLERIDRYCVRWNDQEMNEERALEAIVAHCAPLRELAKIGRLAVEHRKMGTVDLEASAGQWYAKLTEVNAACDAYLAKGAKG